MKVISLITFCYDLYVRCFKDENENENENENRKCKRTVHESNKTS